MYYKRLYETCVFTYTFTAYTFFSFHIEQEFRFLILPPLIDGFILKKFTLEPGSFVVPQYLTYQLTCHTDRSKAYCRASKPSKENDRVKKKKWCFKCHNKF